MGNAHSKNFDNDHTVVDAPCDDHATTRLVKPMPRPPEMPIIGHLHLLRDYAANPWDGFDAIRRQYGECVGLKMGVHQMALVSSDEAMREILQQKGDIFSNRPNFARYDIIFGGDKENSLALCSWSQVHKERRKFCRTGVMPRSGSSRFRMLETSVDQNVGKLVNKFIHSNTPRHRSVTSNNKTDTTSNHHHSSVMSTTTTSGISSQPQLQQQSSQSKQQRLTKSDILYLTSDLFMQFLCGKTYAHDDHDYSRFVFGCDFIFWDINHCYLIDFIPILTSFGVGYSYLKYLKDVTDYCRDFIDDKIFNPRYDKHLRSAITSSSPDYRLNNNGSMINTNDMNNNNDSNDKYYKTTTISDDDGYVDDQEDDYLDTIINDYIAQSTSMSLADYKVGFADLLAGHAAVANIALRLLGHLALDSDLQEVIANEANEALKKQPNRDEDDDLVRLAHRSLLPITEASMLEALRIASSPIVPHVAQQDTCVGDYFVPSGTIVLFNNYHLNTSETLWERPREFDPFRFIKKFPTSTTTSHTNHHLCPENSSTTSDISSEPQQQQQSSQTPYKLQLTLPPHYKPFSIGKRSCLGRKMVETTTVVLAANICRKFRFTTSNVELTKQLLAPLGKVALNPDAECFELLLKPRVYHKKSETSKCEGTLWA